MLVLCGVCAAGVCVVATSLLAVMEALFTSPVDAGLHRIPHHAAVEGPAHRLVFVVGEGPGLTVCCFERVV